MKGLEQTVANLRFVTLLEDERLVLLAIAINALFLLGYENAIRSAIATARHTP